MQQQALVGGPLAADGGDADHREDDGQVLHDKEADRDAPVQRIDLPLVGQQLDDDDGAGERQRHRHVRSRQRAHAERERNQEAEDRREHDLPDPGGQRHRPECPDRLRVELETHHEQQHGDADAGQQLDLLVLRHQPDPGRAHEQPHRDEGHDERLSKTGAQRADHGGSQQRERNLGEGVPYRHAS